jgi:hypothetical protein
VFSAFRLLFEEDGNGKLRFKTDPSSSFEEKKSELSSTIQTTFESQGRVVQHVGKASDASRSGDDKGGGRGVFDDESCRYSMVGPAKDPEHQETDSSGADPV